MANADMAAPRVVGVAVQVEREVVYKPQPVAIQDAIACIRGVHIARLVAPIAEPERSPLLALLQAEATESRIGENAPHLRIRIRVGIVASEPARVAQASGHAVELGNVEQGEISLAAHNVEGGIVVGRVSHRKTARLGRYTVIRS